jgi:hypothetical protein
MPVAGRPGTDGYAYLELPNGRDRLVVECTNAARFGWVGTAARGEVKPGVPPSDRAKARSVRADVPPLEL